MAANTHTSISKIGTKIRRTGIKGIEIPTPGQYRIMVGTETGRYYIIL